MNREVHVRFFERPGVKLPGSTRLLQDREGWDGNTPFLPIKKHAFRGKKRE